MGFIPVIFRAFLPERNYPFLTFAVDYFFLAQKPGDVFLPSGYFLSGHKH